MEVHDRSVSLSSNLSSPHPQPTCNRAKALAASDTNGTELSSLRAACMDRYRPGGGEPLTGVRPPISMPAGVLVGPVSADANPPSLYLDQAKTLLLRQSIGS